MWMCMNVLGKDCMGHRVMLALLTWLAGWCQIIHSRATAADPSCAQKLQLSSFDPCGSPIALWLGRLDR